ncbi:prepilin peptidase [Actinokineospora xionganensis]|uniref:Prepilin peptidase n=1 Tax=Actinokineospora xionganensis TaxID=2684470 RepID=A0ABR7LFA9_9PSEU|nr:A24 family peptidase [Actinokineospora xionganensis]MBC6451325.1 prepilin peptidase [Actinokineospora xionganensis]
MVTATAVAAVGAAGMGARLGIAVELPAFLGLVLFGIALAIADIRSRRLPDVMVAALTLSGLALLGVTAIIHHDVSSLLRAIFAAGVTSGALLVLALLWPSELGFGDVKFGGVLAFYLGWLGWPQVILGVATGFLVAAVVAVGLLLTGRRTLRDDLPLGPFLMLGAWITIVSRWPS